MKNRTLMTLIQETLIYYDLIGDLLLLKYDKIKFANYIFLSTNLI